MVPEIPRPKSEAIAVPIVIMATDNINRGHHTDSNDFHKRTISPTSPIFLEYEPLRLTLLGERRAPPQWEDRHGPLELAPCSQLEAPLGVRRQ